MTTIESLEKVRYGTPALSNRPGPASGWGGAGYDDREDEFRRYNEYVLEEASKALPHPFDLGRGRNFRAVFGGRERWWMWFVPVFSGVGDGWLWETSGEWRVAVEKVRVKRMQMGAQREEREEAGWDRGRKWMGGNGGGLVRHAGSKAERVLGKVPGSYSDGENVPLQRMRAGDSGSESEEERVDLEAGLALGRRTKMEARSAGGVGGWSRWER